MTYNTNPNIHTRNWRTEFTQAAYDAKKTSIKEKGACPLCTATPIKEFTHWVIVKNEYPYDAISIKHDLLLPKRHFRHDGVLNVQEQSELLELKKTYLDTEYTMLIETLPSSKSIPGHYHLHLIVPKTLN
jgi:diadenosine tetraphosphate (Ap4A) HIT family hydrolase